MNRFLRNTTLFLGCLVLINVGLYTLADKMYYAHYKQHSLSYTKYLFADSHGLPLKSFTMPNGIYNFSAGSESYIDIKRKLSYLIQRTQVDTIYLSVDDHTLSTYRERSNNTDRSLYYVSWQDYENPLAYLRDKLVSVIVFFQPQTRSVIRYYYFSRLKKGVKADGDDTDWKDLSDHKKTKRARDRAFAHFGSEHKSPLLTKNLMEIIDLCRKNDITLIGIKFPLTKQYIEAIDGHSYGASEVLKKNGFQVMDFTSAYMHREDYFANEDHLNHQGGAALAKTAFE